MKLKLLILLSVGLLAVACQKRKYPEDQVQLGTEAIYFNGYFDNQRVELKVGKDGYYCYSSYKQQDDSVYLFEGLLKKFNCSTCSQAFKVELTDYLKRSPDASVFADSSFIAGSRSLLPAIAKPHAIRFISNSNKEISSVRWNWNNGPSLEETALNCEFGQPGPQTVSLTVRTKDNCESQVVNKVFVGGETGVFACAIIVEPLQNNQSKFKTDRIGGKPPYRYNWSFGDGSISSQATPDHDYKWAGSYPVKVQITDSENHVCESNYIHIAGNDKSSCTANILLSYEGTRDVFLNGAKIQWTNESNVVFSSDLVVQPPESYFEILNSEPYDPNERGEAGRLLNLRFNVLLSDGSRKVWFKSESAAIVVAYK